MKLHHAAVTCSPYIKRLTRSMESQHPPGRWKALLTAFTAVKGLLHNLAIYNKSFIQLNISRIIIA